MQRCVTTLRPFGLLTAAPLLRRAGLAWSRFMSALSDPYRPERHYMRGPGPKYYERQGREFISERRPMTEAMTGALASEKTGEGRGEAHKYCPRCRTLMVLARVAPKFGPLPELHTYKCLTCGCVIEQDVGR